MKVIKWLFISVFGFAGLVLGSYVAFKLVVSWSMSGVGIDGGAGSWALRSLFHDGPRYYELTTNLEVDGEPVKIKRVIECKPYFAHRFGNYFQKRWYTDQEAMTHRLPDGSGIIVVGPRICESAAHPQPEDAPPWKAFPDLPEDYVPLILWTADADNPEVLEGYFSFDSVERPDSRITFKGISLRNSSDLEPGVYPEEFGVWVNAKFGGLFGGGRSPKTLNYHGYYLLSLGKDEWKKVPELKAGLEAMEESGFLQHELKNFIIGSDTDHDALAIKGVMRVRRPSFRSEHQGNTLPIDIEVLREMHGFERREDQFVPSANYKGVIAYFLQTRWEKGNWVRDETVTVSLEGREVTWPNKSTEYYYDKESGSLYRMGLSFFTFHVTQHAK